MQTMIITCDRCKKEIKGEKHPITIQFWTRHYSDHSDSGQTVYDLCPQCKRAFEKFLKQE